MNPNMSFGLMVALGAGIAIGLQGLFTTITGQLAGSPLRGGLSIHITGAIVGAIMVIVLGLTRPEASAIQFTPKFFLFAFLAGTAGMCILIGISISFPLIGQVAAQGALIFAQMAVAVVVDSYGLSGGEPIPMDWRRLLGLAVLALGTYLLLPNTSNGNVES